jgi:ribosomal protein S8
MTNYLGDLIVRIKNAQKTRLPEILMHPHMPQKFVQILRILYLEGYIRGFEER